MIQKDFDGPRTIAFINPKGGAAKTTGVLAAGYTFGTVRGGGVVAWDNNESRGTLGIRGTRSTHTNTTRELLEDLERFSDVYQSRIGDLGAFVRNQGDAHFDVLASDERPDVTGQIHAEDFNAVHQLLERFYRIILVDTGNNMRAENWLAAADAADLLVVTSTVREDTGYSGLWMLDALQDAGYQNLKYKTVTVLSDPSVTVDAKLADDLVDGLPAAHPRRVPRALRPGAGRRLGGAVQPALPRHPEVLAAGLRGDGVRALTGTFRACAPSSSPSPVTSSVLNLVDRDLPEPGPGEVRVRLVRAGVNPTDWKRRQNPQEHDEVTPGQDGAGVVDAVGDGVDGLAVGDRVWLVLAQRERAHGTAAEYTVQDASHVVPLPDDASYDLGASLGVPAVTAHRALTSAEFGPSRLGPGTMAGLTVLVAGGAGAVGNAAIQLATVGRRDRGDHGEQPREGGAGHRRGRPARRELPQGRHRGGDPGGRARRRGRGGRGGPRAEQRARHRGHEGARHHRDLRQQRWRRADRGAALDLLQEPALPVPDPLHARRAARAGGGRGHLRGGPRRRAAGRRRNLAFPCTTSRWTRRRPRTTRSSRARSEKCSSILPPTDRTLVS